jgi:predicted dinucleotide-binding enzyme
MQSNHEGQSNHAGQSKLAAQPRQREQSKRHGRREVLIAATALFAMSLLPTSVLAAAALPKIGFIGAGKIGGGLARLWATAGYKVMLSARDLGPVKELAAQIGPNAQVGTPAEAAAFGDVVVVTVPFSALPQVGKDYASELKGKIVLDTCNPVLARDGPMAQEALDKGTGVVDAMLLPGTRLVRAFNTTGAGYLTPIAERTGPKFGVPLASDDKEALKVAAQLVRAAGFEPVIVGGLGTAQSFDLHHTVHGGMTADEIRAALNIK